MGKWVPVIAGALLAAYGVLGDVLAPMVASNPKLAMALGAFVSLLAYLSKSPVKDKK